MSPYNQSLQLTFGTAKAFASTKPSSVSSAAEFKRYVADSAAGESLLESVAGGSQNVYS